VSAADDLRRARERQRRALAALPPDELARVVQDQVQLFEELGAVRPAPTALECTYREFAELERAMWLRALALTRALDLVRYRWVGAPDLRLPELMQTLDRAVNDAVLNALLAGGWTEAEQLLPSREEAGP